MFVDVSGNLAKIPPISPSLLLLAFMQWWEVPIHDRFNSRFRLDWRNKAHSVRSIELQQPPQNPSLNRNHRLMWQEPQSTVFICMTRGVHDVEIHVD